MVIYGDAMRCKCTHTLPFVQVFNESDGSWSDRQINAEIKMLSRARHTHINRILGMSVNGPRRCLILEYMDAGALDVRLRSTRLPVLPWRDRARVLLHVARGLTYMHQMKPPVVHR